MSGERDQSQERRQGDGGPDLRSREKIGRVGWTVMNVTVEGASHTIEVNAKAGENGIPQLEIRNFDHGQRRHALPESVRNKLSPYFLVGEVHMREGSMQAQVMPGPPAETGHQVIIRPIFPDSPPSIQIT